jgi:hypothetical protein
MANESERITRLEARMDALRDDVDAIIREQENSRCLPTAIARIEEQIVGIVKKLDDKKSGLLFAITTIIAMVNTLLAIYVTFMIKG